METGLVQSREEFLLPNDAYPLLLNAYVWRERILRKDGYELLGRLRRILTTTAMGNISAGGAGTFTFNIFTGMGILAIQPNAEIQPGSVSSPLVITIGAPISQTLTDTTGLGVFVVTGAGPITAAKINYATGVLSITFSGVAGVSAATITGSYYPGLPVMGLRSRELNNINNEQLVAFDQVYAYVFGATGWQEFIAGTTWTGNDSDFFWSTNYWVGDGNQKIFWVTNFSGTTGDPIRYTNGTAWVNFAPAIDNVGTRLQQCLILLPFRGRLVAFNTLEGATLGTSISHTNRIRWAAIGNPFSDVSAIVSTVNANAWRDDIRGQGGFLDIPTSEAIVAVGFVRDDCVIYCERSTWQLRYTGRSIAPFNIERVNSELGAESTFSAVQFDTSLVGMGDKGVVECDSFKSNRIDIKIPDLIFQFNNENNGPKRVHGIRDFQQRLAYWTFPYKPNGSTYPDRRLVYNYENDSWAIFTDSLTTLGTYQAQIGRTWAGTPEPWVRQNYSWINRPALFPSIVGGNQQGYVEYLDTETTNGVSLTITGITGNTTTPTVIKSPNHNLQNGQVIQISSIPDNTPFDSLNMGLDPSTGLPYNSNNGIFSIIKDLSDPDNKFQLWIYNPITGQFDTPQLNAPALYVGSGEISVRDNFNIVSKKFNFMDQGQSIQIGYLDILMNKTDDGEISLNVYLDYNENTPSNTAPQNSSSDTFFNTTIPTITSSFEWPNVSKNWQRVYCPTQGNFITLEYTLSNLQMTTDAQESDVQIDAQVLWMRPAGRMSI
jgi:hypothetical protein